jgi:hypothetical protein
MGGCEDNPFMKGLYIKRRDKAVLMLAETIAAASMGQSTIFVDAGRQGSSDRPGARKFGLKSRKSEDRKDLMSGPTGDLGGLQAGARPEAPKPTSGPARRFFLCQRVISGRESLFTAARQT